MNQSTLEIANDELAPLFDLLRGDCDIMSPRTLTPETQKALDRVANAKCSFFGKYKNINLPVDIFSYAVFAFLHMGEILEHACQHFLQAFASLGVL